MSASGLVNLTVYNLVGEKSATLINDHIEAGVNRKEFNANNLPSRTNIYSLTVENHPESKKYFYYNSPQKDVIYLISSFHSFIIILHHLDFYKISIFLI
jgi:hypothetical protein